MFLTLNDGTELRYAITTSGAGGEQRINSSTTLLPLNQWSLVTVTVAGTTGTHVRQRSGRRAPTPT